MKVRSDAQLRDIAEKQQKTIAMLENRLDVTTKRFNLIIAKNAEIRNEIEALLKERSQFTALWKKSINHLNTGKQIINDLIEQATIAFNQRDEELNTIQALRERYTRNNDKYFVLVVPLVSCGKIHHILQRITAKAGKDWIVAP